MKDKDDTVARKSTFIFFVRVLLTFISWISFFFIARYMGREVWGMIGFAQSLVGLFLLNDFGFALAHNKKVSEGEDIGTCIGTFTLIKTILTVILISILLGGLFIWENVLGYGFEHPDIKPVIYIMLAYFILFSFAQIPIQTFGGLRQSVKQQLPELIGTFARMPIMIYVALAAMGVITLAYSFIVTGVVMILIAFLMFTKIEIKKPSKPLLKSYARFAYPIAIFGIFSTITINVDKVILQFFWGYGEVGSFFGMQRVTFIMITLAMALNPILFPEISHHHTKKAWRRIKQLVRRTERYLSMCVTPIIVTFLILTIPIIHILIGDDFIPAAPTLIWLSIYSLFLTLIVPHLNLLYGYGRPDLAAKVGISISVSYLILLFVFVPRSLFGIELFGLGSEGAAIAFTIAEFIGLVLVRKYSRSVARVRPTKRIYRHWIAGIMMGIVLYYISNYIWDIQRWYELLIVTGLGVLCYLGVLILLKEFKKKDLHFFLDLLNIKRMKRYVGGELKNKS